MSPRLTSGLILAAAVVLFGARGPRPASADSTPNYPIIVRIVSPSQTITVSAGPSGPLYSADGGHPFTNLTLEQVRANQPETYRQLQPAQASAATPIMADLDAN
jgi:hypothetical protein